jgi:lipoprotein-anchoring transpeptidase ErfK/SrfK
MKHITLISIAILAVSALGSPASHAEPASPGASRQRVAAAGDFGGGFIEMLMTGRDPGPGPFHRGGFGPPGFNAPDVDPYGASRQHAARQPSYEMVPVQREIPQRYRRQPVAYSGKEAPGTIVIDTDNKFLYLVQGDGQAIRYGIGVGREGFTWRGVQSVSMKREWPDWRPPAEMRRRRPDLPLHMAGGPDNPLGARALYLGSSLYRIHGTNEPYTIGQNVSSGCIRMLNDDVQDLYERVRVGTKVIVT